MDITIITIFVLAVFVGFEIITKVPPTLHTPLMSGSNAISGIAIIGAALATIIDGNWYVVWFYCCCICNDKCGWWFFSN